MNTTTIHHYNARIPRSALVDLARPERPPVDACPVLAFEGGVCAFPVLCGDQPPILLTHDEIVALGGTVPEGGDILAAVPGRKFRLGPDFFVLTEGWEFAPC